MAHHRCHLFHHQLSGMWPTWAGHWRGGQGAVAMTHPWWLWRPCWQPADPGETCVPGACCMVGTMIQRGLSLLGAGVCGGGWRPSPLGCTAVLSTASGCTVLPTAFMHWPGGDTEPLPVTCCPPAGKHSVGPFQRPTWGPGRAWVSGGQQGASWSAGGLRRVCGAQL